MKERPEIKTKQKQQQQQRFHFSLRVSNIGEALEERLLHTLERALVGGRDRGVALAKLHRVDVLEEWVRERKRESNNKRQQEREDEAANENENKQTTKKFSAAFSLSPS